MLRIDNVFLVTGTLVPDAHAETVQSITENGATVETVAASTWRERLADFAPTSGYVIDQYNVAEFPEALQLAQFLISQGQGHTRVVLLVERARAPSLVAFENRGICVHPDDEAMAPALNYLLGHSSEHHDPPHSKQVVEALR